MPYQPELPNPITINNDGGHVAAIAGQVSEFGFARFENVHTSDELLALSLELGTVSVHGMTGPTGVTTLTTSPETAEAPGTYKPDYELVSHTDGTAMQKPSSLIVLSCPKPDATGGGASMMTDGAVVFKELQRQDPELLEELQRPDAATFGAAGQFTGPVFKTGQNGLTTVRFRLDQEVRFNHIETDRLQPMLDIVTAREVRFNLGAGEGYVIDNTRMLHGRTKITGERTVVRTHVEPYPNAGLHLGFIAAGRS